MLRQRKVRAPQGVEPGPHRKASEQAGRENIGIGIHVIASTGIHQCRLASAVEYRPIWQCVVLRLSTGSSVVCEYFCFAEQDFFGALLCVPFPLPASIYLSDAAFRGLSLLAPVSNIVEERSISSAELVSTCACKTCGSAHGLAQLQIRLAQALVRSRTHWRNRGKQV